MPPLPPHCRFGHRCLWEGLEPVPLDTHRILGLFLHQHPGTPTHTQSSGRRREVTVLPLKRSNAINIALTALPSPTLLHAALLSPHPLLNPLSSPLTPQPGLLDKDTIQRVRALVPSVEELGAIEEAQRAQAHLPLGPAEHFLRTLGSVPQLGARLALGSFMHEYAGREREIAESLFDLKLGMEQLAGNKTFHCILATLLAIGNFLNGMNAGGFELSYLGRVVSVRDTVEKKPLLYHTCAMVMEAFPHAGDLYTQILALTRCTQVDLQHLGAELSQLEWGCREAWDHLHTIARSSSAASRSPSATFLREAAQRIIILKDVHRRVRNRFHAFLLYLGYPNPSVRTATVSGFCKMVRDFALEYRMVRIQILQQQERQRERERQRAEGAPWEGETDSPRIRSLYPECSRKHEDMEEVLRTPERSRRFDSSLPRTKRSQGKDTPQQKTFTW